MMNGYTFRGSNSWHFHFRLPPQKSQLKPFNTDRHSSHYFKLDNPICYFRGVGSILSLLFYFCWKVLLANNVDPNQMPHDVASYLGLYCLPFYEFPAVNGVMDKSCSSTNK